MTELPNQPPLQAAFQIIFRFAYNPSKARSPFQLPEFGIGIWQQPKIAQDVCDTSRKQTDIMTEWNEHLLTDHIHSWLLILAIWWTYNVLSRNNVIRAIMLRLKHFTDLLLSAKPVLGWDLEKDTWFLTLSELLGFHSLQSNMSKILPHAEKVSPI